MLGIKLVACCSYRNWKPLLNEIEIECLRLSTKPWRYTCYFGCKMYDYVNSYQCHWFGKLSNIFLNLINSYCLLSLFSIIIVAVSEYFYWMQLKWEWGGGYICNGFFFVKKLKSYKKLCGTEIIFQQETYFINLY